MDGRDEVRDYLMSRRAKVTPEDVGIPRYGDDRRVPGLRREEVAMLADVSMDYYTKLERGNIRGASDSVLNAIANALRLDEVERRHLFVLAGAVPTAMPHDDTTPASARVRPSVQRVLDSMVVPAVAYNAAHDLIAWNLLGRAMFVWHFEAARPNMARFIVLDSRAPDFYGDWPLACSLTAAMLRYEAGRDPLDEAITALVGELSTRSPRFRADWADRDVHEHRTGTKTYHHPEVGELELTYDVFAQPGEPGLSIATFTPDGATSSDRVAVLASWAASQDLPSRTGAPPDGGDA